MYSLADSYVQLVQTLKWGSTDDQVGISANISTFFPLSDILKAKAFLKHDTSHISHVKEAVKLTS